jgi:TonB-dependent receptor
LAIAAGVVSLLGAASVAAQGTESGTVVGRVVDDVSKLPLPGAMVGVEGTNLERATDLNGAFRISGLAAGAQTLTISYLGHIGQSKEVVVEAGAIVNVTIELTLRFAETVEVRGERGIEAVATALNVQRTAPNITNVVSADQLEVFPDANAAEAAQRISGITVERDQGEGRYVLIRGTSPRLNSMTINGERIPAPEGEQRSVAIDVIPADLLQAIQVSKALTPDMDGDAIGGTVNLLLKEAPEEPRVQLSIGGGYNDFRSGFETFTGSATLGRRSADGKFGFLVAASGSYRDFGSENFEVDYDDGDLDELDTRYYEINRQRYGVNAAFDYRLTANSTLFLNGMWNRFRDEEFRWRKRERVGDDRIERDLKDRLSIQEIFNIAGGGRHFLGGGGELDYKLSYSRAGEDRPDEKLSIFRQDDVEFDPNVSPDSIDPDNIRANPLNEDINAFALDEMEYNNDETRDRDYVASMNLRLPLPSTGTFNGFVKFGGKYRKKEVQQIQPTDLFSPDDDVMLTDVLGFQPPSVVNGRYELGPFQDYQLMRTLRPTLERERDYETEAGDYEATEDVAAGYAMTDFRLGTGVRILGGLRYEHTSNDYTGYTVEFDDEGDYLETRPLTNSSSYGQLLPMVHFTYSFAERTNLRAAVTRTLARPDYYDLVPYNIVLREDNEIERGNPDLQPTVAWNADLMAAHYFESVGVISAGLFYKQLDDFIYFFTTREEIDGDIWEITQPRNGESATLRGVEIALQGQMRFLPEPLDGLGLYLNYTFTDSEATFPGARKATLPGQSKHVGNLALSYEKGGFNGRVSVNFHGKFIDEAGELAVEDIYYDNHYQLDFSATQAISDKVGIFVQALNLTNEPLRYYLGSGDRPLQEEYYGWWATFGVKLDF